MESIKGKNVIKDKGASSERLFIPDFTTSSHLLKGSEILSKGTLLVQGTGQVMLPSQSERFPVRFPTLAESERGKAIRSKRNETKRDITERDRKEVSSLHLH